MPRRVKQPGEPATLYYDSNANVAVGDIVQTNTGRRYLVVECRHGTGTRHPTRWHLQTVVMEGTDPGPPEATVHFLHWYRR
jgi:hypothetical protein